MRNMFHLVVTSLFTIVNFFFFKMYVTHVFICLCGETRKVENMLTLKNFSCYLIYNYNFRMYIYALYI